MSDQLPNITRLEELLAGLTLGDLSSEEHAELQDLLDKQTVRAPGEHTQSPHTSPSHQTDAAAGALSSLAGLSAQRPLPPHLRARLIAQGVALTSAKSSLNPTLDSAPNTTQDSQPNDQGSAGSPSNLRLWGGWFAAAAALAVAAVGWMRPPSALAPAAPPSQWTLRQQLINENPDTVVLAFANTPDPASKDLSGDVVWNQRLQQGYLRFKGLANNDPRTNQYQLWIFDQGRPPEYPVDGGVFDARSGIARSEAGDIIIPIDAKLLVRNPAAFAVTIEQAGGVVVTKRERVIGLAAKPEPQPESKPSDPAANPPATTPPAR